jgi:hypothetical protein
MTRQINPVGFWDSTPIGRSIDLYFCPYEQLSPQLILEDKVFRSVIRLQNNSSQIQFLGTLISDDQLQRLTYVIDRHSITNDINHHQPLTGEFLIPIQYDNRNSTIRNHLIQDGIKVRKSSTVFFFLKVFHSRKSICTVILHYQLNYIDFHIYVDKYPHIILHLSIYLLIF